MSIIVFIFCANPYILMLFSPWGHTPFTTVWDRHLCIRGPRHCLADTGTVEAVVFLRSGAGQHMCSRACWCCAWPVYVQYCAEISKPSTSIGAQKDSSPYCAHQVHHYWVLLNMPWPHTGLEHWKQLPLLCVCWQGTPPAAPTVCVSYTQGTRKWEPAYWDGTRETLETKDTHYRPKLNRENFHSLAMQYTKLKTGSNGDITQITSNCSASLKMSC